MVKRVVQPERLLVMNLKEGWQPLCTFFNKPVPREPFPRLNDAEEADKVAKGIFARCMLVWLGIIGATAAGAHMAARLWNTRDLGFVNSGRSYIWIIRSGADFNRYLQACVSNLLFLS